MALTHKQDVANRFSKASSQYYALANIQNDIAIQARAHVPCVSGFILDIGCATGEHTCQLGENTLGLDLAKGMVIDAKRKSGRNGWVNGDMDALPFQSKSFAHVFSSMALQWSQSPTVVLAEIHRVLKEESGATLLVPIFGAFWQLAHAYAESGLATRLNPLLEANGWLNAAVEAGFSVKANSIVLQTDFRETLPDLLRSISKVGASASLQQAPLLTRRDLKSLETHYPNSQHGYDLDYRCLLMSLEK